MGIVRVVKLIGSGLNNIVVTGGLVPMGAYDNGTDYAVGDSVDYLGSSYVMYINAGAGTLPTDTTKWQVLAEKGDAGTGDVVGPASATDNAVALFDGVTGKLIQDSTILVGTDPLLSGDANVIIPNGLLLTDGATNGIQLGDPGDPGGDTAAIYLDPPNGRLVLRGLPAATVYELNRSTGESALLELADLTSTRTFRFPDAGGTFTLGAASATDNNFVKFDGTTGKLIKNSSIYGDPNGSVMISVDVTAANNALYLRQTAADVDGDIRIFFELSDVGVAYHLGIDNTDDKFKLFGADPTSDFLFTADALGNVTNLGYMRVGGVTAPANTTAGDFTFIRGFATSVSVTDDPYGAGWNGSTNVPTKNALYDKIETLSSGGISEALAIAYACAL